MHGDMMVVEFMRSSSRAATPYGRAVAGRWRHVSSADTRRQTLDIHGPYRALTMLLRDCLLEEAFSVRIESEGSRDIAEALSGKYSIAVMDVMLPQLGLEALGASRGTSILPVLMLTPHGDDLDRVAGLELGADDSVGKPVTARELIDRIRASLRRTQSVADRDNSDGVLASGNLTMRPPQRRAEWRGIPLQLTSTEFSLLEILVRHAGHPVSKMELSKRALGKPFTRHDRSIDVHLSRIRRKLRTLADGRSLIVAVGRLGYQFLKD
jgi:two-component system, OmpR family, response regulator